MPSPKSNPGKPLVRKRPLLICLSIIVVAVAVFFGLRIQNDRALAADRARFAQAEQDVAELSKAIIAETGEPLKMTSEKFCSRPSLKYEKGSLTCNVYIDHGYEVENATQATEYYRIIDTAVSNIANKSGINISSDVSANFRFNEIDKLNYVRITDSQKVIQSFSTKDNINCSLIYNLYPSDLPPSDSYLVSMRSELTLAVGVDCTDSAKAEYYPIEH